MSRKAPRFALGPVEPIAESCPDRVLGSALDRRVDELLDNSESEDADVATLVVLDCPALVDNPVVAAPSGTMRLDIIWFDAFTMELVSGPDAVSRPVAVALHLDAHHAAQRTLPSGQHDDAIEASTLPRPAAREGAVLRAAISKIDRLVQRCPTVFKIGITNNPVKRCHNRRYGYRLEGFRTMRLLWASHVREGIAMLEAALILHYEGRPGFRNVATGGEGPPNRAPPFFCYVVTMPADGRVMR